MNQRKFDLEDRTAKFGIRTIRYCREVPRDIINDSLVSQLVRCATSVGANYSEADNAESKKDFRHKIGICKKEAKESKHFFRMLAASAPDKSLQAKELFKEANELLLIFSSIYLKLK